MIFVKTGEEIELLRESNRLVGMIGAVANTLRLELVDLSAIPPAAAAFIGALTAGILASLIKNKVGYPRISLTVPSIVIMVPGLYLYRGFYNLGIIPQLGYELVVNHFGVAIQKPYAAHIFKGGQGL